MSLETTLNEEEFKEIIPFLGEYGYIPLEAKEGELEQGLSLARDLLLNSDEPIESLDTLRALAALANSSRCGFGDVRLFSGNRPRAVKHCYRITI